MCFFVLCNRHWFNRVPGPDGQLCRHGCLRHELGGAGAPQLGVYRRVVRGVAICLQRTHGIDCLQPELQNDIAIFHYTVVKGWSMRRDLLDVMRGGAWAFTWLGALQWGEFPMCFVWEQILVVWRGKRVMQETTLAFAAGR